MRNWHDDFIAIPGARQYWHEKMEIVNFMSVPTPTIAEELRRDREALMAAMERYRERREKTFVGKLKRTVAIWLGGYER